MRWPVASTLVTGAGLALLLSFSVSACGTATTPRSGAPGQRFVVYAVYARSNLHAIWRVGIDGTHAERLALGNDPEVSPDGRRIAFDRGRSLYVMPAVGGAPKRVYTARAAYRGADPRVDGPEWSPDSRYVAFVTGQGGGTCPKGTIVVLDTVSHHAHTLPNFKGIAAWSFDFSPNSREVAYEVSFACGGFYTRLYTAPTVGGKPLCLTPTAPDAGEFDFSPDSRRIVYAKQYSSRPYGSDLYVVPTRGGTTLRLTKGRGSNDPVWGKPGIAFDRSDFVNGDHGDIWLSDGVHASPRRLTHDDWGTAPFAFSADGKELIAVDGWRSKPRLWRLDVASGVEHPFTKIATEALDLSADGRLVLAIRGSGYSHTFIEVIPVDGGKPQIVARGPDAEGGPYDASWNVR